MDLPALCEVVISHPVYMREHSESPKGRKKQRELPYFDETEKQRKKQRIHVLDDSSGLSSDGLLEKELQELPSKIELIAFYQFLRLETLHFQRLQRNSNKCKNDWQSTRILKGLREQLKEFKQDHKKAKEALDAYRVHRMIKQHMHDRLLKFEVLANFFRKKYAKMGYQWKVESKGANYTFSTHIKGGVFPYQRCHSAISACYKLSFINLEGQCKSFLTDDCVQDLLTYKQGTFSIRRILNSTDILHASSNKIDGIVEEKLRPFADMYLEKVLNKEMQVQEASKSFVLQCKRVLRQQRQEQSLNLIRKQIPNHDVALKEMLNSPYFSSSSMLSACKDEQIRSLEYDASFPTNLEKLITSAKQTPKHKKKFSFIKIYKDIEEWSIDTFKKIFGGNNTVSLYT